MRGAVLSLALSIATAVIADEVGDSRRLQQEALAAHKEKKLDVFLEKIRAASDLRPRHPTLLMQLALALAANGQHRNALGIMDRVAAMGFVYTLDDRELDAMRDLPAFARVVKRFEENARPIGTAKEELTIERLGLIPEGLAYDAKRKRWLISSVRTGAIFAVKGDDVQTFVDVPWGVFGMALDAKRNVLWATTTAMPQVEEFDAADKGKSALLRIDAGSGEILETLRAPDDGAHHFGDVIVTADGEVFVSDSSGPAIFRVAGSALEPFVSGPFVSMQGIAPVRRTLYVADYAKGLFAVNRDTREVKPVYVPPNASLLGIDGLYAIDDRTLVATQNGTNPYRIIRINLAPGGLAVSSVDTLLANASAMGDPTLGTVVGKRFFFNANGQWDQFGDDGRIGDPLQLSGAVVLSVAVE
jgi:hypothetical protein